MRTLTGKAFYDTLRDGKMMGPTLDKDEVDGTNAILDACMKADFPVSHTAYALATAYHETAHTMKPIKEYGGPTYFTRMYDITGQRPKLAKDNGNTQIGDGAKFFGRGYVQLTWRSNYEKAAKKLGISDLVSNPDRALEFPIAAAIMTRGMSEGWFTSKSLTTYLPVTGNATREQFKSARKIINGTDKDDLIAGYALEFQKALSAASYK